MPRLTPINLQKMEYDVTTAEGPCRVTIVCGTLQSIGSVFSSSANTEFQNFSASALVDPTLTPGQFRKATAIAALASLDARTNAVPSNYSCTIDNVAASLDDESGQIELRVDAHATSSNGGVSLSEVTFQVTTLAKRTP
jgi:hypothetical protein